MTSVQLITTKFAPPRLGTQAVAREQLLENCSTGATAACCW